MSNSKKINIDAIKALTRTSRDEKNKNKYVDAAEEAKKHILENFEEKIETSAANGLFYADIYSWEYVENKHNKTKYCFNNVRISDILFKPPTDLEGNILDKPLRKKLETYFINLGFKFSIYSWRDSPSRKKSIRISWYDKQRSYRQEPYERRSPQKYSDGYASANPHGYTRANSHEYAHTNDHTHAHVNSYKHVVENGYRYSSNGSIRQPSHMETHRDDRRGDDRRDDQLADLDNTMANKCENGSDYFQSPPHNEPKPSHIELCKDDKIDNALDNSENEEIIENKDNVHNTEHQPSQY